MQIKSARFLKSIKEQYSDLGMPEIAICGKSNVGKSSLINYLACNNKLARISSTPGKTRLINFFVINDEFLLADLPGYGYAKVSYAEQKSWAYMIESYLSKTKRLCALLVLVDIRHLPAENDKIMLEYASIFGLPVILVATKADKIAKTRRHEYLSKIIKTLGVNYPIVAVSSQNRFGADMLLSEIKKALKL